MIRRISGLLVWVAVAIFAFAATPAFANSLVSANASVTCSSYQLAVSAHWMDARLPYTIDYSIELTPSGGGPIHTITGSITVVVDTNGEFTDTVNGAINPSLTGGYAASGTATLMQGSTMDNTLPITFSPATVSCAPPPPSCAGANSNLIDNLGAAGPSSFAVLSLGGTGAVINLNLATVNGNIGLPNTGTYMESQPSVVNGNLIVGSATNTKDAGGKHGSILVNDSELASAVQAADSAAAYFAGLSSTAAQSQFPSSGSIGSNLTITGGPGVNVINTTNFNLNANLTFNAPAGASFVINDSGNFHMQKGLVSVTGGIGPLDIVWNVTNAQATVSTMVPSTSVGILLAPNNTINSMDSSAWSGEMIGGYGKTITLMSGVKFTNPCQQ